MKNARTVPPYACTQSMTKKDAFAHADTYYGKCYEKCPHGVSGLNMSRARHQKILELVEYNAIVDVMEWLARETAYKNGDAENDDAHMRNAILKKRQLITIRIIFFL